MTTLPYEHLDPHWSFRTPHEWGLLVDAREAAFDSDGPLTILAAAEKSGEWVQNDDVEGLVRWLTKARGAAGLPHDVDFSWFRVTLGDNVPKVFDLYFPIKRKDAA